MKRKHERIASMAALLSSPVRLAILDRLRQGPCIVGDLVSALGEAQASLSKQLAILREAGLLRCRPEGRCREYAVADPERLGALLDGLLELAGSADRQAAECRARRARHGRDSTKEGTR